METKHFELGLRFAAACLLWAFFPASAADPVRMADSLAAANMKTGTGKRYADSAAAVGKGFLEEALKICRDSAAGKPATPPSDRKDTTSVDVYMMLNRRGGVKNLVVNPPQAISDCLARKSAAGLALPAPPGPNHWIRVRVRPASRPD